MNDFAPLLQASLGDTYTIERELDGGGMSRVFVAMQRELNRRVVIKLLPAEMAGSVSLERFKREIAVAARLQQANIVPLLSAGEAAGVPYYVMPYVDGESLRARLAGGELPIAEATGLLKEIARALAYAHAHDVVHRDIKPDNVLVSGGTAMVMDFGVARALGAAATGAADSLTATGMAIGTPAYMAPEQASGDRQMDHRVDIYAFGCLAYELLTGAPPFAGRSAQQMIAAHFTASPDPVERRRPAVPLELAALVAKCLEKNPADRPQDAAQLAASLDAITLTSPSRTRASSAAWAPRTRWLVAAPAIVVAGALLLWLGTRSRTPAAVGALSVAVLPFENISRDTTIDYLEDGISDHVRDAIGLLPGVTVKARSSSRHLKGKAAQEAGRTLGATLVLLGTVSHAGGNLHVTAEIVRAADDNAAWSGTFEGPAESMPGIQDSLVRAVTAALRVRPARVGTGRGTNDAAAYDEFLRGRYEGDRTNWDVALAHFRNAVARDPAFARGHANLAIAYSNIPTLGITATDSLDRLAIESAKLALALDSSTADAYLAFSDVKANELRLAEAVVPLERAIVLDTTLVDLRAAYGLGLLQIGQPEKALSVLRRAYALDPLSSTANGLLAYAWLVNGHVDSAVARGRAGIGLDPNNVLMRAGLALDLAYAGQRDSSAIEFRRAFELGPDKFDGRVNLVYSFAVLGRMDDARRERAQLDKEPPGNSPRYRRAMADVAVGNFDAAMMEMEQGVAAREPLFGLTSMPCDPRLDPLKRDPRFGALMKRLGVVACAPRMSWPFGPAR